MIFTQEQIDEIKQRLSLSGIKDSELDKLNLLEHPLTGQEVITIVKDGENLRISVEDLYEEFAKYINEEGFFNVSVYLGRLDPEFENAAKPCTLEEAINACPSAVKNAGQIITFIDNNKEWQRYQYQGYSVENWNKLTLWKDLNNVSEDIPVSEDVMTFNITEYMPGGSKYKQPIWAGIYTIDGITPVSQYRVIFGCDENLGDVEGVDMEISDTLAIMDINTNDATIFSYILFVGNSTNGYRYQTTIDSDESVPDWISKAFGNNSSYIAANIASLERKINLKLGEKSSIVRVDDYFDSSKAMPNGYFMFEQQPVSQIRVLYDNDSYLLYIQAAPEGTGTIYLVFENFDEYYDSWRYLNQYTEENCPSNVLEAFGLNVATSNKKGMMSATDKSNLDSSFKNVSYNSTTKKLIFTKNNNTTISLDATPFIKDGMVNSVSIDNGYLVITFNTDSGKENIRVPLTDVFNPDNYYNKTQTNNLLGNKVDKEQGKGLSSNDYTTEEKNKLSDLPTATELTQELDGKADAADLTQIDDRLGEVEYCLGDYLKETYVFNALNKPQASTEPVYTTKALYTVANLQYCKCRLSAGGQQIDALWIGSLWNKGNIYFTKSGKATIYLVLNVEPHLLPADVIASICDNNDNVVRSIRVHELSYNTQRICTPITYDVAAGYYLKVNYDDDYDDPALWLGQIDFEIIGPTKQISIDVHANSNAITTIEQKIPAQASSSNQLADKDFVNSSIATATATYRGSYNLVSDLSLTISAIQQQIADALAMKMEALSITPDNNDYCFVQVPTADATPTEIARIDRYKYDGTAWAYEYTLNNSGYTAAQWAALNSGIISGLVAKLSDLPTATELATLLAGKASTQELAGKQDKMPIMQVASGTTAINAAVNTYYEVAGEVGTLAITLPEPTNTTKVAMVVIHLTAGTTPNVVIGSAATVDYSAAYDISASKEYEINCLYNGDKWVVADMEVV